MQPQAGSPPRNGADARGGVGTGGRRGETPAGRPALLSAGKNRTQGPGTSSRRSTARGPRPRPAPAAHHHPHPFNRRVAAAALKPAPPDDRLTSYVTPRRAGAGTAQEGVSGARARRGPLTSGSGARSPARPSAAQVAARSGEGATRGKGRGSGGRACRLALT